MSYQKGDWIKLNWIIELRVRRPLSVQTFLLSLNRNDKTLVPVLFVANSKSNDTNAWYLALDTIFEKDI